MKRNSINTRKGFTLVEMLGVLAIIAILISVISVGVLSAINRARVVATVSNFKNLETALLAYIALPESAGQIPLTKMNNGAITIKAAPETNSDALGIAANVATPATATELSGFALEQIFLAAGTLERLPNWRIGNDGVQKGIVQMANLPGWNRKKNAFATKVNAQGTTFGTAGVVNWTDAVRTECAPVDRAAVIGAIGTGAPGMMSTLGVNFQTDGSSDLPGTSRCAYVVLPGVTLKDAEKLSEELNGSLSVMDLKAASPIFIQTVGRFVTQGADVGDGTTTCYYFLANL
jgi:prepilin-type N-terminal cleavage/methylation domain-containing protein